MPVGHQCASSLRVAVAFAHAILPARCRRVACGMLSFLERTKHRATRSGKTVSHGTCPRPSQGNSRISNSLFKMGVSEVTQVRKTMVIEQRVDDERKSRVPLFGLVVCMKGECSTVLCWIICVLLNELSHDTTCSLQSHEKRRRTK